MKSAITAICLLALTGSVQNYAHYHYLGAYLAITDHKDFYSGDEVAVQVQQESVMVMERKPTTVTTLTPVEQRATSTKPVVTKPVTKTKPAETKFVAEPKPVMEEKLVPAAIPVVTAEEALELNESALFLKRILNTGVKSTIVEGEIVERSELPDPQKSDYPNCRFTVHFNGNSIKSGEPCPKELSLIIEGFENYRVLPNNDIKTGDKVQCTIFPFDKLPEDDQSTQQADDLELVLLESYYAIDIRTIEKFTDNELMPVSGIYFSEGNEEYISLFDRHLNDPVPTEIRNAQNADIQHDAKRMDGFLSAYTDAQFKEINARFAEAWNEEKKKDPPGYNRVENYVWRNLDGSFWSLPAETSTIVSIPDKMSQEMLDCFSSLKKALEANGIQLIVSLVPDMNVISARVINNDFKDIPDIQTATYVKQLSEIGVETIYASDQIIDNYNRFPFAFFIPENPHPSDTTQDVLADILAERLKRYAIAPELDSSLFSETQCPHAYKEDKAYWFPQNCDIGDNQAGKSYTCRAFLYNGEPIKRTKESPVMIIGNSYIETPVSPPESFPMILSRKLCAPVDWYRISGFGPFSDILIQLLSNPDMFLKDKKVFIFHVSTVFISSANHSEIMLDIGKLDRERVLLNKKSMKGHLLLQSNATVEEIADSGLWGPLANAEKAVLRIEENGELTLNIRFEQLEDDLDNTEPIVCNIPYTCAAGSTCKATINGITESIMYSTRYAKNSRFFNLAFKLPDGTKEITVKVEGKPGSLFAVKDIQLWQ